jgi:hypothetical protein
MPWLPFYAAEGDLPQVGKHLNASPEVAFVVSRRPGEWVAVKSLESLAPGRYCLWHIPSGPLPLVRGANEPPGAITDPFAGWSEAKAGANPSLPYFGAGHPGVLWLNIVSTRASREGALLVGLSSFEWIGNHYKVIGSVARPETEQFWKALRRWLMKLAVKVPRGGPSETTPPEIWSMAGAQSLFAEGARGGNV